MKPTAYIDKGAKRTIALVLFFALISGCAAVGPNYVPPDQPDVPDQWNIELEDGLRSADPDPNLLVTWWEYLEDPVLTDLIRQSLEKSPDMAQALARVREARARRGLTNADRFPSLDAGGSATRAGTSESTDTGNTVSLYDAAFDASWELDIFGGVKRSIEAADADLMASEADLSDVRISLIAEVAENYLEVRTFQTRLDVAEANIDAQTATFDLISSRYDAGLSDELAVEQARYNLESTRSQLPTLRSGLSASENRLSVLLGMPPGAVGNLLEKRFHIPVAPVTVAVGVPADALRRRPDVRRAERELAAQTARIGVAEADRYPKFSLLGSVGIETLNSDNFLSPGNRLWSIGPSVSWHLFDAGAVKRNIEVQTAIQAQYLSAYQSVVLSALEEVENGMKAYVEAQNRREHLRIAVESAAHAADLAHDRYTAGLVDFSNVLDAQRSLLSYQDELAINEGEVTQDLITLFKALGGGWTPVITESKTGEAAVSE